MMPVRGPFASLLLCLALAVNLLAPFASAAPLFVEICSGHRTILVPVDDAPVRAPCEACPVCCAVVAPPDARSAASLAEFAVAAGDGEATYPAFADLPRRTARAPPLPSV